MRNPLLATLGAAGLLLGASLPAAAANTFNVQVTAPTVATITVTSPGNVICAPGNAVTGIVACTNTVNATGAIRSSAAGTASLSTTAVAATIVGTAGNSIPVSAISMTCADNGSSTTHGAATFASAAASTTTGTQCASWAGPNVFTYNVNLTFGIDASKVNADTYTVSTGWTVLASAT
ncbi:MAG TPA: hypothetical protein VGP41_03770 [Candidatus Lustribacter sp.]|jgi:hypothetical protein|nr:hypothetical protein [Candidatus Lustribacter sp.]